MTFFAGFLIALSTAAGNADAAPTSGAEPAKDPDPVICHKVEELGSLLKKRSICMRKSEWRSQRDADKQMIDRAQLSRGTAGGN